MCGIAGVITSTGSAETLRVGLQAAASALRHRGPDDFGNTLDGPVGFVHTRLSIIDLAGGHQPIVTRGGELSAVVNGEIYNYIELRNEFVEKTGITPLTNSDSECVLQVYAAEGCPPSPGLAAAGLLPARPACARPGCCTAEGCGSAF